jgi:hypothetical protein
VIAPVDLSAPQQGKIEMGVRDPVSRRDDLPKLLQKPGLARTPDAVEEQHRQMLALPAVQRAKRSRSFSRSVKWRMFRLGDST